MDDFQETYFQFMGTDHAGAEVTVRNDIRLNNTALTFDDGSDSSTRFGITIPASSRGRIEAIEAGSYKLMFHFNNKYRGDIQQAAFWVKKRDFDSLFIKTKQ